MLLTLAEELYKDGPVSAMKEGCWSSMSLDIQNLEIKQLIFVSLIVICCLDIAVHHLYCSVKSILLEELLPYGLHLQ